MGDILQIFQPCNTTDITKLHIFPHTSKKSLFITLFY
nr:MAG TPA: hypothetical protein [Caudoviricetes sp.]